MAGGRKELIRLATKAFQEQVWLPHPGEVWVPARLTKHEDDNVHFEADTGESIEVPAKDYHSLDKVYPEQLEGQADIITMAHVNEGALLYTVKARYMQKKMYTRVARTLIAVNPFTPLAIYSQQYLDKYAKISDSLELPPHIYGIGQDAIRGLRESGTDQAVLVSGESGAGKTESAKLIMTFVAGAVSAAGFNIMEKVLLTNPVLEAFGNAMTVRNNNSSRFGKWQDLRFTASMESSGCTLRNYLLETTRVVSQASAERNYHVFFQLIGQRNNQLFADLNLSGPEAYRYVKNGKRVAPGIDDAKNFKEMYDALLTLGFDETERSGIFRVVAAVLNVGNIEFKAKGEGADVEDAEPVKRAAELLNVSAEEFSKLMIERKLTIAGKVTVAFNRVDQARAVKDAISRLLYGRLFDWLIARMNVTLGSDDAHHNTRLLGLLDIAGFECFEHNSLEQLLINLSNEHLQQHFNNHVFKTEQEECRKEGVTLVDIKGFHDNAAMLALIDAKGGILDALDETCMTNFQGASDASFVNKVCQNSSKHPNLIVPKKKGMVPQFGVKHFAGDVLYSCDGWLEKNVEKIPAETAQVLSASESTVVQSLAGNQDEGASNSKAGKKQKSVSGSFRGSLKELMAKINAAQPHYVRCVKPNAAKVPGKFEAPSVMEQLLFSGVFACVQIRQEGYAHRIPHEEFVQTYSCIVERLGDAKDSKVKAVITAKNTPSKVRALVEALPDVLATVGHCFEDKSTFAVGHTKVFARFTAQQALESARSKALAAVAIKIQKVMRGSLCRRRLAEKEGAKPVVKAAKPKVESNADKGAVTVAQRAAMEAEFAKRLEEEKARVQAECEAKFAIEQEQAAQLLKELTAKAESEREDSVARERAKAEREFNQKVQEVTAELTEERRKVEKDFAKKVADQQAKAKAAEAALEAKTAAEKETAERFEKERQTFLNTIKDQRAATQEALEKRMAVEKATAEEDLKNKMDAEHAKMKLMNEVKRAKAEREALEQRLEEEGRKVAEIEAKAAERSKELVLKLAAEHAAAEQNLERRLLAERAAAEDTLIEKLRLERAEAEREMEKKFLAKLNDILEEERKDKSDAEEVAAKQVRNARLEAEEARKKAEEASKLADQMADEKTALQKKLEAERVASEQTLEQRIAQEHALAQKEQAERVRLERLAAECEFGQQQEKKRAEAAKKLATELSDANEVLAKRLAAERLSSEEALEKRIAHEKAAAAKEMEERLRLERLNAEREYGQKQASADAAAYKELADEFERKQKELEAQLRRSMASEQAAAEEMQRLKDERSEAEAKFWQQVDADRQASEAQLEWKLEAERATAGEVLAKEFAEKLIAEQKVLAEEHKAAAKAIAELTAEKGDLMSKLAAERAAAQVELAEKLKVAAALQEEERKAAQATAEEQLVRMQGELELRFSRKLSEAQRTAEQELEKYISEEHATAVADLRQKLADATAEERRAAEVELEDNFAQQLVTEKQNLQAEHKAAKHAINELAAFECEFLDTWARERAAMKQNLEAQLDAAEDDVEERKKHADEILDQQLQEIQEEFEDRLREQLDEACGQAVRTLKEENDLELEAEVSQRMAPQNAEAEQELANKMQQERAAVEQSLTQKLQETRALEIDKLNRRLVAEAADLEEALINKGASEEERTDAMEKFNVSKQEAENSLIRNLVAEEDTERTRLQRKMSADRDEAESALREQHALERAKLAETLADSFTEKFVAAKADLEMEYKAAKQAIKGLAAAEVEYIETLADEVMRARKESNGDADGIEEADEAPRMCAAITERVGKALTEKIGFEATWKKTPAEPKKKASIRLPEEATVSTTNTAVTTEASEEAQDDDDESTPRDVGRGKVEQPSHSEAARERLKKECATAMQALEARLSAEQMEAQQRLADKLLEDHITAESELARKLVEDHRRAEARLAQKITAEKAALQGKYADEKAKKETMEKLLAERLAAEEEVAKQKASREVKEKELAERMAKEREDAEAKLVEDFAEQLREQKAKVEKEHQAKMKAITDLAVANEELALHMAARQRNLSDQQQTTPRSELKKKIRRQRTMEGVIVSERRQLIAALKEACELYDVELIEKLLGRAEEEDFDDDEPEEGQELGPIATAKELFENMQNDDWVSDALEDEKVLADTRPHPPVLPLHRLLNLAKHLRKGDEFQFGDEEAREAMACVQRAMVDIAKDRNLRTIFDTKDVELRSLATDAFGELKNFSRLKLMEEWEGTEAPSFPGRSGRKSITGRRTSVSSRKMSICSSIRRSRTGSNFSNVDMLVLAQPADSLLSYTKDKIAGALTLAPSGWVTDEYDTGSTLMFFNLLVCMGDRYVQDSQRKACRDAIIDLCATQPMWRDEIYCQVMKQLKGNPSPASVQLGWELLKDLCISGPPEGPLREFVRRFIADAEQELRETCGADSWALDALKDCKKVLNGEYWHATRTIGSFFTAVVRPASWVVDTLSM